MVVAVEEDVYWWEVRTVEHGVGVFLNDCIVNSLSGLCTTVDPYLAKFKHDDSFLLLFQSRL
jgi:hypothetical protein